MVAILQALVVGLSCRHGEMWLLRFEDDWERGERLGIYGVKLIRIRCHLEIRLLGGAHVI